MAKVFTFWQMLEEEVEFIDFLETTGTVIAYPDHWVRTEAEVSPQSLRTYLTQHNPLQVLLGLESGKADVVVGNRVQGEEQFFDVDLMSSCLVGYRRPRIRPVNQLGKSNLATYLDFYKGDSPQRKPDWFQDWVKQVFSWAKKRANRKCVHQEFAYPATPLVEKLVEEGQIEVVH
jgi:hypothetical protein